jgi:hypothetical protein
MSWGKEAGGSRLGWEKRWRQMGEIAPLDSLLCCPIEQPLKKKKYTCHCLVIWRQPAAIVTNREHGHAKPVWRAKVAMPSHGISKVVWRHSSGRWLGKIDLEFEHPSICLQLLSLGPIPPPLLVLVLTLDKLPLIVSLKLLGLINCGNLDCLVARHSALRIERERAPMIG